MSGEFYIPKIVFKLIICLVCGFSFGQTKLIGKVNSEISGKAPISDVYVQELITKQSLIMADSLGKFEFENLEPNKNYKIEILAFGYETQLFEVYLKEGVNEVEFELKATCEYNAEQAEIEWNNGKAKLLLIGSIAPTANSSSDEKFEKKFNIKYYDFGCSPPIEECVKLYNERMFELMDKKYGKAWRKTVRSDVEYLN